MFVLSRKKEKVEAGMEQSLCRTVSIRLRMLDTAQVEYRKLSEVHLQCRVDDNQPEWLGKKKTSAHIEQRSVEAKAHQLLRLTKP